jgi:hypothetical protein
MNLFTDCFKQISFKKEREIITPQTKKELVTAHLSSSKIITKKMEAESTFAATTESLQQSSKEGKGFKYNEDGRRYHGNEEVVYIMPNDEDGNS